MSAVRPFIVEREFGAHPQDDPPSLSAELERVQREAAEAAERARVQAEAVALARLRAERDTALLAACEALGASLARLEDEQAELERRLVGEAAELALEAADLLAGAELTRRPTQAIEDAITRALEELRRGTPLEVRVHPELVGTVEARVEERQQRDRRRLRITVLADEQLAIGDARLRWERGEAQLSRESRRAALMRELAELLAN